MKIKNRNDLPEVFVNAIEREYKYTDNRYSVTELLSGAREVNLKRKHYNDLEIDPSDCVDLIIGTAVHSYLESFDKTNKAEIKLEVKVGNYTLVGVIDFLDEKERAIVDYKTISPFKIKFNDFEDWRLQGLIYAWMSLQKGYYVDKLKFYGILKTKDRDIDTRIYPWIYEITTQDLIDIEMYINDKLTKIANNELCSPSERWARPTTYAVMKNGRKTALRVLETMQEAEDYKLNKGGDYIETREGIDVKCCEYCSVKEYCTYWREKYGNTSNDNGI